MAENEGLRWIRRQLEFEAFMTATRQAALVPAALPVRPPEPAEPATDAPDRHERLAVEA